MSLQAGQIVRYSQSLWRVDYVNECRARIIPLTKRHVVLLDDEGNEKRAFDSEQRGVNISPDSPLEVVTDIERAADEIELAKAERELAQIKAEAKAEERRAAEAAKPPRIAPGAAERPSGGRSAQGWQIGPARPEGILLGTKAAVYAWVQAHPGSTTKQVAAGCSEQSAGAVGACLDRFRKIGVLISV